MFVASLGQPGLSVETDAAAEPSDTGGADFAALMAMAAAFLAPAQAPAAPPAAPSMGGAGHPADAEALPAGAGGSLAAFAWPDSGPGPMFAPALAGSAASGASSPAKTEAPTPAALAQPEVLPAPVPALAPSAPSAPATPAAASTTAEAIAGMTQLSGRQSGPTGDTRRAEILPPPGETAPEAAAIPVAGRVSPIPVEGSGDASTDEEPGSKPVGTAAADHDRFPTAGAHPGGPSSAAGVSQSADAPANSTPVRHPPVVDQVVSIVEPLRHRGDGHHELTLDLRPADLGPIRVEVTIDRGTVHLSLHAEQPSTGTLLHEAMPELRTALEEGGLIAGRLGVGAGDREGGRPPAQSRPAGGDEPRNGRSPLAAVAPVTIRPPVASAAGALDLLL